MISPAEKAEEYKWKVEDAARTLREAAKVKRNKKLYKDAVAECKSMRGDLTKVISGK